jgi:hypothetical protein
MAAAGLADGIKGVDFVSASVAPHAEILAPAFQDELGARSASSPRSA